MKTSRISPLLAACGLALAAAAAQAAPVLNINGGVLDGASGVIVNGLSYDVNFVEGDCKSLHGGCNDASQFAFHTSAEGLAAMAALNDQVWGTTWGADNLRGCDDPTVCITTMFLGVFPSLFSVGAVSYYNYANGNPADKVVVNTLSNTGNTDVIFSVNIAVWKLSDSVPGPAEVPEPASFALATLALGIAGLTGRGRSRQAPKTISPSAPN